MKIRVNHQKESKFFGDKSNFYVGGVVSHSELCRLYATKSLSFHFFGRMLMILVVSKHLKINRSKSDLHGVESEFY